MNPTAANLFRASRPLFNQRVAGQASRSAFTRSTGFRAEFRQGARQQYRFYSSETAAPQESWFKRMWDSPIGFKTVHFW